jgi:hypothetical protein
VRANPSFSPFGAVDGGRVFAPQKTPMVKEELKQSEVVSPENRSYAHRWSGVLVDPGPAHFGTVGTIGHGRLRGASGIVALVEFAPCGARRPGVPHPLDVAFRRPTDWLQLVNQPQTEAEVAALRCCVNRGRPFGDPNWVTDTAKRLGLESTIRPRGRPKKQS